MVFPQAPSCRVHGPDGARFLPRMSDTGSSARSGFAERLAATRRGFGQRTARPGLTAQDFAAVLGLEPERYRKYERGEREPPLWVLQRITQITGVSLDHLVGGRPPREAA